MSEPTTGGPEIPSSDLGSAGDTIPQTGAPTNNNDSGDNPAWGKFLEGVPSGLHDMMKGRLREWDADVQGRFSKVHSEYEPYKWAKENQIDGNTLQQAYGFYQAASNDPRYVWQTLGERFGFNNEQGQQTNQPSVSDDVDLEDYEDQNSLFDIEQHPRFIEMQQQLQQFNQYMQQQQQAADAQASERWLDGKINDIKQKYGQDVDIEQIMMRASIMTQQAGNNFDYDKAIEQAAQAHVDYVNKIRSAPRPGASAPTVLSPGGGSPVAPSLGSLSDRDRRAAAIAMLTQANADG